MMLHGVQSWRVDDAASTVLARAFDLIGAVAAGSITTAAHASANSTL